MELVSSIDDVEPFTWGLGANPPTDLQQETNQGGAAGAAIGGTIATIVGGPVLGGIVSGAISGLTQLISAVEGLFSGCGATCTEATQIVNQVEPYLQQNNQIYFSNPNRTTCDQATALATFNSIWQIVTSKCGNAALGAAGQNCINERGPNAVNCTWGVTSENEYPPYASVPYPVGVCWNWFLAYYDPILNDVPPGGSAVCAATAASTVSNVLSSLTSNPLLLIGLAVAAFVLIEVLD